MSGAGNGGGEEVKALSSQILTTVMNVPLWEDGDFVTNEHWMLDEHDFRSGSDPYVHWVEDGQMAGADDPTEEGREINDDSLHWFYAYDVGHGVVPYVAPWTFPGWTWISYTLSDPDNNGSWCEKIEETQVACQGGFPKYANAVEVGMEAADEAQPENSGKDETNVQHVNGDWYWWNEARWSTVGNGDESEAGVTCVTGYGGDAGWVNFATPADLCGYE
jgi:hypothetical protein